MAEGDGDTWYCYYAVMKLHWKPSDYAFLPPREKALLIAFIEERIKQEERERKEIKAKASRKRIR